MTTTLVLLLTVMMEIHCQTVGRSPRDRRLLLLPSSWLVCSVH
jgi:hypothetical protein